MEREKLAGHILTLLRDDFENAFSGNGAEQV